MQLFKIKKYFLIIIFVLFFVAPIVFASSANTGVGLQVTCPNGNCSRQIPGCTDQTANNYDSLANFNDGSCTYNNPHGGNILGCTDPLADNYNREANVDDGSCRFSVPNVRNFLAHYVSEQKAVHLTWVNPNFDFAAIRIVRLTGSIPASPDSGILVYEGRGESAWDEAITPGDHYFYTAFVRDRLGRYSSGVVASERIPTEENVISPTPPTIGPFETLPQTSIIPTVSSSLTWFLRFIQPQEKAKTFDEEMKVLIRGDRNLTVEINYTQVPTVLKTIGLTIVNPKDNSRAESFILRANSDRTVYSATIEPLGASGVYPVYIYLINYHDQTIKPIRGRLVVSGQSPAIISSTINATLENITPAVVATGLAVGLLPSLSNILALLARLLGYFFGRRKKDKPWGVVYDSITKQPLDPAYVVVTRNDFNGEKKEFTSAITDLDGRFGFLLPAGTYYLKAGKTHYQFPSKKLTGQNSDELYDHLYFGGPIMTNGEEVVNLNIPMDPLDFDWNEFAKTKSNFFKFYSRRELWKNRIFNFIYSLGFLVSILALIFSPSTFNFALIVLYCLLYLINRFWRNRQKAKTLYSRATGEPLPFAIIRFYFTGINQEIKKIVTDKFGRFYLLVNPGTYYYTVEEKLSDGSYQKIFQSEPVELKKGILDKDLFV